MTLKNCQMAHFLYILKQYNAISFNTPFLTGELKLAEYIKDYFRGGRIIIQLLTCEDKIVISYKLQKYVVKWYHTYLLHPVMDIMEEIICQHFYWPGIIEFIHKEVKNCDTLQRTKWSTKKYGKFPAKLAGKNHGIKCGRSRRPLQNT